MTARAFRIMIIANDRSLLRRLSNFLNTFGYDVNQVGSSEVAKAAMWGSTPDFLLIDDAIEDRNLSFLRELTKNDQAKQPYSLLLTEKCSISRLTEALEYGIDDFLTKPINYGELMARLRAGARSLEFERRLARQRSLDPLTELPSRSALEDHLRTVLSANTGRGLSCVGIDVDFFSRINYRYGRISGNVLIKSVSDELRQLIGGKGWLACMGGARFCVVLSDATDGTAMGWADQARMAFSKIDFNLKEGTVRLTASFGVAAMGYGEGEPDELVDNAIQAIKQAKSSGRNSVARCGQFDSETLDWQELATAGKLFDMTTADDVMVPCTVVAHDQDPWPHAAALLERTRIGEVPVVGSHGRYVGLITEKHLESNPIDKTLESKCVRDVMSRDLPRLDKSAGFTDLMALFTNENHEIAVVVQDGRPLGTVRCSDLASLCDKLTAEPLEPALPFSTGSEYLRVPELV